MIESLPAPFADHSSDVAADYPAARPEYPEALFEWFASLVPAKPAGCGSGQASRGLAAHFVEVQATETTGRDPVAAQSAAFAAAWGDPATAQTLRWPMFLHARRKAS